MLSSVAVSRRRPEGLGNAEGRPVGRPSAGSSQRTAGWPPVAAHQACVLCVTRGSVADRWAHKERVYAAKNAAPGGGSGRTVIDMYIVMLTYVAPREEIDYL